MFYLRFLLSLQHKGLEAEAGLKNIPKKKKKKLNFNKLSIINNINSTNTNNNKFKISRRRQK